MNYEIRRDPSFAEKFGSNPSYCNLGIMYTALKTGHPLQYFRRVPVSPGEIIELLRINKIVFFEFHDSDTDEVHYFTLFDMYPDVILCQTYAHIPRYMKYREDPEEWIQLLTDFMNDRCPQQWQRLFHVPVSPESIKTIQLYQLVDGSF